jgi:sugar O-acyltransferase (sialic acid O-acetyltransferase NeuD family)
MESETIYFVGVGGHGKVVLDALLRSGMPRNRIVISDDDDTAGHINFYGFRVYYPAVQDEARVACFHVAIGDGTIRKRIFEALQEIGSQPMTICHPTAAVSPFSSVAAGAFLAAQSVVGPGASVEKGTIINHGSVIDHDCRIGAFAHIAPNATIGGGCQIGDGVLVGAGANILPAVAIGAQAVIGAGAVVLKDVEAGAKCAGVPAVRISLL